MRIVKYLLFLLLIFIIAGSIYVATKEADYLVEREITTDAPVGFVFSEVSNFKNWEKWGPWASANDAEIVSISDTEGEGTNIAWRSDGYGDGAISTTQIESHQKIEQQAQLEHFFGTSTTIITWNFEEVEEGTKVQLSATGNMNFWEKLHWEISNKNQDEFYGNLFETSLQQLTEDLQLQMQKYSITVHGETEYGGGYFMYSSTSAKQQNVQKIFKETSAQIQSYMNQNNITDNGRPFILYHSWNDEEGSTLFSVCVPTPTKVVTPSESNILSGYLPTQHVLRTTLRGDRKNLAEAWEEAFTFIKTQNLVIPENFKPFEVYITKETEEEIPANLITEIYIPIEENPNTEE